MVLISNVFVEASVVTVVALEVTSTADVMPEVVLISNIFDVTASAALEVATTAADVSGAIVVVNERTVVFTKCINE